jgi:hypothetical protein
VIRIARESKRAAQEERENCFGRCGPDRVADFVQFVRDDIARRRAAEDAFYAQLAAGG